MSIGVQKHIVFSSKEYKDLKSYCDLNGLDEDKVIKESYFKGFNIERYGLLSGSIEKEDKGVEYIEKEVIKYVDRPVEIIKEIPVEVVREVIKEVMVEVPKEVKVVEFVDKEIIREVPVEKIVEKIVNVSDNSEIERMAKIIQELEKLPPKIIEVVKEVPVEIIKEVLVEKTITDDSKQKKLEQTLQSLKLENINKDRKINELEQKIVELEKLKLGSGAVYLRGSNLDETLYK